MTRLGDARVGLALVRAYGASLGRRALEVLTKMADHEDDDYDGVLVWEGQEVWVGNERTSSSVALALLRACAVSDVSDPGSRLMRYAINETGRKLVARARRERAR